MKIKNLISLAVGITFVTLAPVTWAAGHGGGGGGFGGVVVSTAAASAVVVSTVVVLVLAVSTVAVYAGT